MLVVGSGLIGDIGGESCSGFGDSGGLLGSGGGLLGSGGGFTSADSTGSDT